MEQTESMRLTAVLRALADLAPTTERTSAVTSVPTEWFRWLALDAVRLFLPPAGALEPPHDRYEPGSLSGSLQASLIPDANALRVVPIDSAAAERLAAVDQIRPEARSLRVGWLFVAGADVGPDGKRRSVLHPLVTLPVRVERSPFGSARLVPAGDPEMSALITDRTVRDKLEAGIETGGGIFVGMTATAAGPPMLARLDRLQRFARDAAAAAGFAAQQLVPAGEAPGAAVRSQHLVIVAGVGIYALQGLGDTSRAGSLRAWANRPVFDRTAFHALYLPQDGHASSDDAEGLATVESPFVLTPRQREAVLRSRHAPITLVSGAPGTGKSHTITAIACDALAAGGSVLVAAKSDATVDALLDLLERSPGPDPVVFGSNERRESLAARLAGGQLAPEHDARLDAAHQSVLECRSRRDELRTEIAHRLTAEMVADQARSDTNASGSDDPIPSTIDLSQLSTLLDAGDNPATGWRTRWRARHAQRRVATMLGRRGPVSTDALRADLDRSRTIRARTNLRAQGGLDLEELWPRLVAAEADTRSAQGRWLALDSRSHDRLNTSSFSAVGALSTALRSGRAARRQQLAASNYEHLTRALPLWVGTLGDVDDLLPAVAGLFDLVILDEASSIDQPLAASTLLRGKRAVIAGDPRQLRQVSFISDAQHRAVMAEHGLDTDPTLAARLDVRRNSSFDVAAGAAPVLVLDEHFRSDPHLVDFVARRLYGGSFTVATRSPVTQSRDCVDVLRTSGARDGAGVVTSEVECVVQQLRTMHHFGMTGIGVVTPFRAQADAIEDAVLRAFTADDLEALDLRVGTVHAFQGNERDTVIASFGVGSDDASRASWRFVEDPHLFSVFMTRARRRMLIVLSADPPEGGLVASYLAQADNPPGPPKPVGPLAPWPAAIADDLAAVHVPIRPSYATGRHVLDLCVDNDRRNVALCCDVHPDGATAHIERHLALVGNGWEVLEGFRSRWEHRRGELVIGLAQQLAWATTDQPRRDDTPAS